MRVRVWSLIDSSYRFRGSSCFGVNNTVSKCNRETTDFDYEYDGIRTAVLRGLTSRSRKLPKLIGGQVGDVRYSLSRRIA